MPVQQEASAEIYPNPTNNTVCVVLPNEAEATEMELVNMSGQVVAAKTFKANEDATPYFRNGALIDFSLVKQKELVDKCGGERYRRQLNYWIGTADAPGSEHHTEVVEYAGWDGF
jgi:hypothetical protein